jgi:hypothetical protein
VCNVNGANIFPPAVPKMGVIDWQGVSDSTWLMKSRGGHTTAVSIVEQVREKIKHAEMDAIAGGTSKTMTASIAAMATRTPMQRCRGTSAKVQ